jgi:hypothetical protein
MTDILLHEVAAGASLAFLNSTSRVTMAVVDLNAVSFEVKTVRVARRQT